MITTYSPTGFSNSNLFSPSPLNGSEGEKVPASHAISGASNKIHSSSELPVNSSGASSSSASENTQVSLSDAGRQLAYGDERVDGVEDESAEHSRDIRNTEAKIDNAKDAAEQELIEQEVAELSARDQEVRTHEQAHAAAGGQYAGAPSYEFERGPDGVSYAVSGEVPIDASKGATPEETLQKAAVVKRAALAPAEPSPQDRRVAAQASQMAAEARAELSASRMEEDKGTADNGAVNKGAIAGESETNSQVSGELSGSAQSNAIVSSNGFSANQSEQNTIHSVQSSATFSSGSALSSASGNHSNSASYTTSRLMQSISNTAFQEQRTDAGINLFA